LIDVWKKRKTFFFPNYKVELVIRIGAETLEYLLHQIGARIQVAWDADSDLICNLIDIQVCILSIF
jgi:hypothetical protein